MSVYDVMTRDPVIIHANASIAIALRKMEEVGCHHLPVLSAEKHLIGILSFGDCQIALGKLLNSKKMPSYPMLGGNISVTSAMTHAPIVIEADEPAFEAARLMLENYIGCLPVMRGETLIGIVTRSDLLMAFMALSQKSLALLKK